MGLIRKTLAVGTIGVVNGSSKKQRNAKAQLVELRAIRAQLEGPKPRPVYVKPPSPRKAFRAHLDKHHAMQERRFGPAPQERARV